MVKLKQETYFPRGAVPATGSNSKSNRKSRDAIIKLSDDLFQSSESPTISGDTTGNKKKKGKNKLTTEENELLAGTQRFGGFNFETLTYDSIVEDTLSLGRIVKIKNHEMIVNLPGRVVGAVPAPNISKPYRKVLEAVASNQTVSDPWHCLPDMFQIGQVVAVRVKSVKDTEKGKSIILSTSPSQLHKNFNSRTVEERMILTAAVESIEDHGYIMDLGIKGTRSFLEKDHATKFVKEVNRGRPLGLGQLVQCQVLSAHVTNNLCNVQLTANPKPLEKFKYHDTAGLNYSLLLPGMLMDGIVMETYGTGMKVHVMEGIVAHIHRDHMDKSWTLPTTYEIGSKVTARVLFVLPNGTNPSLSLQPKLFPSNVRIHDSKIKLGFNETVKIVRHEKGGVAIRFPATDEKGVVSFQRCSDDATWTSEHVKTNFPIGSQHVCKVIDYNSMDMVYICAFQKSLVDQKIIRLEQLESGSKIDGIIDRWTSAGAFVKFGLLRGFVPNHHFGNIPIRDPQSKFPVGTSMKFKVLKVDAVDKKVLLTAKKDLVKNKVPVLTNLSEIKKGLVSKGVVHAVNQGGVIVETIGGLLGFIPRGQLGLDRDSTVDVSTAFFKGRIVIFQVVHAGAEPSRLILTLRVDEDKQPKLDEDDSKVNSKKSPSAKDGEKAKKNGQKSEVVVDVKKKKNQKKNKEQQEDVKMQDEDSSATSAAQTKKKDKKIAKKSEEDEEVTTKKKKKRANENDNDDRKSAVPKKKAKNGEQKNGIIEQIGQENQLKIAGKSFWDIENNDNGMNESTDDENDGDERKVHETKAKVTRKERAKLKEKLIRDSELALADSERTPGTEDDFDRLVLASPNSSLCWIKYMAFHLENGNFDKARAVGRRGLSTILFREEQERFNIWVALLNIETSHGTEESLNEVFQEALRANDAQKVYNTMTQIYCGSQKLEEAENIFKQMIKKYRENPEVWTKYGQFLFRNSRLDDGRKLYQKAILNLAKDHLVRINSKFAQFEFGDVDRGCTMFDHLVGAYRKRTDLWLMYANTLSKFKQHEKAKSILMKTVELKLPARKMKPIFTRLLQIDSLCSNPDAEAIRQLATTYTVEMSK